MDDLERQKLNNSLQERFGLTLDDVCYVPILGVEAGNLFVCVQANNPGNYVYKVVERKEAQVIAESLSVHRGLPTIFPKTSESAFYLITKPGARAEDFLKYEPKLDISNCGMATTGTPLPHED